MITKNTILNLAFCLVIFAVVSACDVTGEEHFSYKEGDSLEIVGPASVTIAAGESEVTANYYSRAFTVDKDYSWAVTGGAQDSVYRDGEFVAVTFSDTGTYTLSVDDGQYQGSLEVTVKNE